MTDLHQFGSNKSPGASGVPLKDGPSTNDGAQDESSTKQPNNGFFGLGFGANGFETSPLPQSSSDSGAGSPVTSPISYGYPFSSAPHSGLVTPEHYKPTAIQG